MNITAHQEKEENEESKKGKRGAGEMKKRKQATNSKAVCCPSAVVEGAAWRKNKRSALGNWDPGEGQQPLRPNPNGIGNRTTTLKQLLIVAAQDSHYANLSRFMLGEFSKIVKGFKSSALTPSAI